MLIALTGCSGADSKHENTAQSDHGAATEDAIIKGPHGGRLLVDGEFALELAIFETGTPPEFRVWVTDAGVPVAPRDVDLHVTLVRLGEVRDEIDFAAQDDFLRGDTVIYEPHSFVVTIEVRKGGVSHRWEYENFEGRTRIEPEIARTFGLETELAGPAKIRETVAVYGRIVPDPERVSSVSARFEGVIESVAVSIGDTVRPGQTLARIESNESLKSYTITAPIEGILTKRQANPGEQTGTENDCSRSWTRRRSGRNWRCFLPIVPVSVSAHRSLSGRRMAVRAEKAIWRISNRLPSRISPCLHELCSRTRMVRSFRGCTYPLRFRLPKMRCLWRSGDRVCRPSGILRWFTR